MLGDMETRRPTLDRFVVRDQNRDWFIKARDVDAIEAAGVHAVRHCGRDVFVLSDTDADWQTVSAGYFHTAAIKTNGTLWAWGLNKNGELGSGAYNDSNTPIHVGSRADWRFVSAGRMHTVAIKNVGTLWAWGWNDIGHATLVVDPDAVPSPSAAFQGLEAIAGRTAQVAEVLCDVEHLELATRDRPEVDRVRDGSARDATDEGGSVAACSARIPTQSAPGDS